MGSAWTLLRHHHHNNNHTVLQDDWMSFSRSIYSSEQRTGLGARPRRALLGCLCTCQPWQLRQQQRTARATHISGLRPPNSL